MKIAIIGSGKIVEACLDAISQVKYMHLEASCVRKQSMEKGQIIQKKYNIPKLYTDYDMLLRDEEIDFVYIGLVNKLHYEYTKKALLCDKNVICEKPFTTTKTELAELSIIAKRQKLFLFEAITTLYMPNFLKMQELIKSLTDIRLIQCNFSQYSSRYDEYINGVIHPVFDVDEHGGCLSDVNIYNLHLVIRLFGRPREVNWLYNKGYNGVDTSDLLVLQYDNYIATCHSAKDSYSPSFAIIQGRNGYVKIEGTTNICPNINCNINGEIIEFQNQEDGRNYMCYEWEAFCKMYYDKNYNTCYENLEHSLLVMELLERAKGMRIL